MVWLGTVEDETNRLTELTRIPPESGRMSRSAPASGAWFGTSPTDYRLAFTWPAEPKPYELLSEVSGQLHAAD